SYTATLTVTDSLNRSSQSSLVVTVNNVAPTVSAGGPYSGTPGTAINFTSTVSDPSSADTAAGFTYAWTFGDTTSSTLANPSHTYRVAGTYKVSVMVTDKDGGSPTATATVSVTTGQIFPNNGNPPALPAPTGTVIHVSTATALQAAVANLHTGDTILI